MLKYASIILTVMGLCLVSGQSGWAQTYGSAEQAEVAKAPKDAKVTLQQGLTASQREGTPFSGEFEVEHGTLQLSVYTMKGDKFSEVVVDHRTGKVAKVEPITGARI